MLDSSENIATIIIHNLISGLAQGVNNGSVWFAIPVLLLSLVSTALIVYGWMKRNTPLGKSYSVLMLALTLWLVFYSLRVLFEYPSSGVLHFLEFSAVVTLPLAWIVFSIVFSGAKKWLNASKIVLLSTPPVAILFAILYFLLSPDRTGFLTEYQSIGYGPVLTNSGGFTKSLLLYVIIAYSLTYFIIGTILILSSITRNKRLDKKQVTIINIGVLIPWVGNIVLLISLNASINFIPPLVFILSSALIAWGVFYNHFIDIITLAHRVLIERMGDGLIILDKQNWILDINNVALTLFRTSKHAMVGQPVNILFKRYPFLEALTKQHALKNHEIDFEFGEKLRSFTIDVIPLYTKQKILAGKIILLKEITAIKETYRNLEKAKNQATKADSLKSAFLANLSHEIKTPMNAIIGFSELLNDVSIADDERHEFIDHIRNSGSTLLQLIDDMMDISKLDAGQFTLNPGEVDLSKMMAELFARYNDHLISEGKTGIDLILDTELLEKDLHIVADGERIRQVLTNLLSNAVKFTKQGQIEFGYHLELNKNVRFFVKDTGVGIPFDKHKIIFERFGRVYTSNKQEYSGTGLGLALSKGMVKLMGGSIWFESVYGKGSSFYFEIPYKEAEVFEPVSQQDSKPTRSKEFDPDSQPVPFRKRIVPSVPDIPEQDIPAAADSRKDMIPEPPKQYPVEAEPFDRKESIDEPDSDKMKDAPSEIERVPDLIRKPDESTEPVEPQIVIPEPTTDLDAESDPYLDYLFDSHDRKTEKKDLTPPEEKPEDPLAKLIQEGVIRNAEKQLEEQMAEAKGEVDLDAESDPYLDALFAEEDKKKQTHEPVKRPESIRDHIKDMPEEADLIFEPEYTPTSTIDDDTNFSGSKLLVIDYDDMSYLFIEMILRPTKIQLIRAKTFQQGLNLIKGGTSLTGILLTSEVPDIELIPGIKAIKKTYPRANVVAVTPFASEERRKECLRSGCLNVLPKPIKQRELLAAVRNLHTISNM